MKILIAYATYSGATHTCTELLAKRLSAHHEVRCFSVSEGALPSPQDYDCVILGSPIRMGHVSRPLKRYMRQYGTVLSAMPTALFFCCGYPRQFEEYKETQVPRTLDFSLGVHCFGGELKPQNAHGWNRLAVWCMRNAILTQDFEKPEESRHEMPELFTENIALLADRIEKIGKIETSGTDPNKT